FVQQYAVRGSDVVPVDPSKVDASRNRMLTMQFMSGLQEHTELVQGLWFSDKTAPDGVIEAVLIEEGMYRNDVHSGAMDQYRVGNTNKRLIVKIVGAVTPKDMNHDYWSLGIESQFGALYVSEQAFMEQLLEKNQMPLQSALWFYSFNLSEIQTSQLAPLS